MDSYASALQTSAFPIGEPIDLGPLVQRLAQARIVMLGEATHGTHEFYELRRLISEWLIVKHGFRFIAVEGDWPDCAELDRYVCGKGAPSAREALDIYQRWPTWMWANTEIIRLAEWMRSHNQKISTGTPKAHFHGLDVYSLFDSMRAVIQQLEKINPFLARRAKTRYACFDPFLGNEKAYALSLSENPNGCEKQVMSVLEDLLKVRMGALGALQEDPSSDVAALFDAKQNARVVRNAERYYRTLVEADEASWNVRDQHMLETLDQLLSHYSVPGQPARAIVWAHNTHIGDYRATDMARSGMVNIGGLAREKYGEDQVALLGFGTYEGTVIASHSWDGPVEELLVPPGKQGTVESAAHDVSREMKAPTFACVFDRRHSEINVLDQRRGHRAIGVVYDPRRERWGNYVPTALSKRYDAFLFVDRTRALEPLIRGVDLREIPETWPMGQ